MKDFFGQTLAPGDRVAYLSHCRTSSSLEWGTVEGFTKCFVVLGGGQGKVSPYKVIKKPEA